MSKVQITDYESARDYILGIPKFTGKHTMEDTKAFWRFAGSPCGQADIIHVAGTNGKGSVCTYLRNIYETAGLHTAVFVSPHLVSIRERFLFDGNKADKETFLKAFLQVYEKVQAFQEQQAFYHPSFFEYLFFMFLEMEQTSEADLIILETGLGGRLDATNIMPYKKACVITEIGMDHMEYLGDTVEQIAAEKAGILREDVPLIYAGDRQASAGVIAAAAKKLHAPAYPVGKCDFKLEQIDDKGIAFSYKSVYYKYTVLHLMTRALYQMENAALAVRTVEVLSEGKQTVTLQQIRKGLDNAFWEGRMEELLPEVYVDGAHNEDGISAFLQSVAALPKDCHNHLIFAAVHDKRYEQMIQMIAASELFDEITITKVDGNRAASVSEMLSVLRKYTTVGDNGYEHAEDAVDAALLNRQPSDRILIAGSLYLAGQIKAHMGRNSDD